MLAPRQAWNFLPPSETSSPESFLAILQCHLDLRCSQGLICWGLGCQPVILLGSEGTFKKGTRWEKTGFLGHVLEVDVGSVVPSSFTLPSDFHEVSSFLYHTLTTMMVCAATNGINYAVPKLGAR